MKHEAYEIIGEDRPGPWLITCDHASNRVPDCVNGGDLGLPDADMNRHIAYDVGAEGVTRFLSEQLDSPAIMSRFSRLVIDPNRGETDPTVLMKLYDGSVIPANRHADDAERQRRIEKFHRPYSLAAAQLAAAHKKPAFLAIHSFTPKLAGRPPRPWDIAVLHEKDARIANPLLDELRATGKWCVGENEPYGGHLDGDALDRLALCHNHANVLIEIRNDLIETVEQQRDWAEVLAPILSKALAKSGV